MVIRRRYSNHNLTFVRLGPRYILLRKQCRFRSVGFPDIWSQPTLFFTQVMKFYHWVGWQSKADISITTKPMSGWVLDISSLENSGDPDQLASNEASWSGFTLFLKHLKKLHPWAGWQSEADLEDNCIQNFHLGRYIMGYTVGNLVLRWRVSGTIKCEFRTYIQRYTSPSENFEYGYPHSNALLTFSLQIDSENVLCCTFMSSCC